jgi:hypothetical protein
MMRVAVIACVLGLFAGLARAEGFSLRDAASAPASIDAASAPAWNYQDGEATREVALSPGKAVLYSLLLPGLGDWKLGHRDRAATFFAVEGVIWASFIAFEVQGGNLEDEYQGLAVRFAGVSRAGHSDEFYATIRDFDSGEEYEAGVKDDGRFEYLDATDGAGLGNITSEWLDQYFIENRVSDYEPWLWASTERRLQYSEVRSASKTAYRRADYMLAAAAANRVVSSIFAFAAARSAAQHEVGLNLDISPRGDFALTLTKKF